MRAFYFTLLLSFAATIFGQFEAHQRQLDRTNQESAPPRHKGADK